MKGLVRTVQILAWSSLVGAVVQEMRKPEAERTWHGEVFGMVPYDFRVPTTEKIRAAYWAPDRDELFSDAVFGVGWAVNVPVAARRVSALCAALCAKRGEEPPPAA